MSLAGTAPNFNLCKKASSSSIFDKSFFKEGSYVIDVGISVVDGKSYGDIDTSDLDNYLIGRAPYPGGIGPVTVSGLYSNLAKLIS